MDSESNRRVRDKRDWYEGKDLPKSKPKKTYPTYKRKPKN